MTEITFHPVSEEDLPFVFGLYASTRAAEMAMVPWDDAQKAAFMGFQFAAQLQHYQTQYPEAEHLLILRNGSAVGRLYVSRHSDHIHILDITVSPAQRGAGTGTAVLQGLLAEAAANKQRVTIRVESFNPSAKLFERLGFAMVSEDGFLLLLEWRPPVRD